MNNFPSSRVRQLTLGGAVLAAAALVAAILALSASATTSARTIGVGAATKVGARTEPIAVDHGRAVYDLLPETTAHLLCTQANGCFRVWPPVTVAKGVIPTKAAGVKGTLGTISRDGVRQVTLDGHPLYTFAGDHGAGAANGNGIASFGGTWHVFGEGRAVPSPTSSTSSSTTSAAGGTGGTGGGW